jgi:hypothetical protein
MKKSLLLFALGAPAVWACGVCVEDKVAATYDYAVVQHALARGQVVVYCEMSGRGRGGDARLRQAAARVPGLDAASVRISAEPAALSFALDAAKRSPAAAAAALQHAVPGVHLHVIRIATAKGLQTAGR